MWALSFRKWLNVDTDAVGYAQFGFVDEQGAPIPGSFTILMIGK